MDSLEWDDYDISQSEIETKLASGEMTDDDSIPELSPFETRDAQIPTNQTEALLPTEPKSPQTEKPTKRTNVVDIRDLDTDARLKKPRTSDKMSEPQRQQLNNDLNDVLAWLDKVKCDLTTVCDCVTMRELELSLAELKELQKQIESRNPIVKSIRILATPLSRNDGEMKTKLHRLEQGWDRVNNSANQWRETLQSCFSDSKALRTDVAKIRERSTHLDQQREDLASVVKTFDSPLSIPLATLRKTHKDLVQIRFEVLEDRAQVASLQEMSHQLFLVDARYRGASSPPVDAAADTCDKLNDLGGRLRALLDRVTDDIHVAESALQRERHRVRDEASSNSDLDSLTSESSLRSATPIKLKMLRRKIWKKQNLKSYPHLWMLTS
uniref:KASH domain-containing protein n=1 Tax=Ciona savignyi TaxID=51511 RepID=H2YLP7_CIOSA